MTSFILLTVAFLFKNANYISITEGWNLGSPFLLACFFTDYNRNITITLGFFISVLCPIIWCLDGYKINNKKRIPLKKLNLFIENEEEKSKKNLNRVARGYKFLQDFKYGPVGLFFFPGLSVLANGLLSYNPLGSEWSLSETIEVSLLSDLREQEEAKNRDLLRAIDYNQEEELEPNEIEQLSLAEQIEYYTQRGSSDDMEFIEQLESAQEEQKKKKEAKQLRFITNNVKEIHRSIRNWSPADLYMSLAYRVILQDVYPVVNEMIDNTIIEAYSLKNSLTYGPQSNYISEIVLEVLLALNLEDEKKQISYEVWHFLFNNLILHYLGGISDLSRITILGLPIFLKKHKLIPEDKKPLYVALILCLQGGYFYKYVKSTLLLRSSLLLSEASKEPSEKINMEKEESFFSEKELLFYSMTVFNYSKNERVKIVYSEQEKGLPEAEALLLFYRERLFFCLELCGIEEKEALFLVDKTLKEKDAKFLADFLLNKLSKEQE